MRTSPKDIGELLWQSLENGVYPNDQLPSERDLAEEFAVSRQTIRAALQPLLETGRLKRLANGRLTGSGQTKVVFFFFPAMVSQDCASHYETLRDCTQELNLQLRPVFYANWLDPTLIQGINKADIIVLLPFDNMPPWLTQKLRRCGKPVLVLEYDESCHGLLSVDLFPEKGMETLLGYLDAQGFRDMNLLNIFSPSMVVNRRRSVWQRWLKNHGGKGLAFDFIVPARVQMVHELRAMLRKCIQAGKLPMNRLMLCTTLQAAQLFIRAAADLGMQAGRDYSVASIDGELETSVSTPAITSIDRADAHPFFTRFLRWALSGQPWSGPLYEQIPEVILIEGETIVRPKEKPSP